MVFTFLFSLLPSWTKANIEPEHRNYYSPEDPEALIKLADKETSTTADQMDSPVFYYENERMPTPRTASQIYQEAKMHERVRQNGPPNSVMSQETESPAFVERLKLLEERIAESEKRGSVISLELERTQFEMLELRKALQASNEIIKQLEQMLGNVVLTRQSTTPTSYAEEQIHHIANAPSQQVDDQAYQTPYRLIKDKGIRSSARPVLASVAGFPPPTPEEFQQRIWPIQEPIGNIEVFIPKPLPAEEILPSETKENPHRLVKDKGIRSSARPVLASVAGFPPPTPEEFQQRIWPIQEPIGNIEVFIPKPLPAEEILPGQSTTNVTLGLQTTTSYAEDQTLHHPEALSEQVDDEPYGNHYRKEKQNGGIQASPRPVITAVTGFPPPTPHQFQERNWPAEDRSENVEIFTPTLENPISFSLTLDDSYVDKGITEDEPYGNHYRKEKQNGGIQASPRPVITAVTGFPPPTPHQFQERNWPAEDRSENVEIFTPTLENPISFSLTLDESDVDKGITDDKAYRNPYRMVKETGIRKSPRPVLKTVKGFPPPTPEKFQPRIWPVQDRFENVKIFTPTLENPIPFSLTLDESYVDENEIQLRQGLKTPPNRQKRGWFSFF
ncbi:hypothetical protein GHT06_014609 [Daphnia sinensis]|uniref:Uncharacterized protein n=1 Tax=Daphnia sinensis TaxID=1820382 RepID=A0AAD5L8V9_9CRUS|nr:hypothetical protein GHT06_014609 [Daphnia sinensis]